MNFYKSLATATAFLITISFAFSQIDFQEGYFIDQSGQRVNCLIKNVDWKNNPTEFQYRLSANDPIQVAQLKSVKEFAIDGSAKFLRAKVRIDRSSNSISKMSEYRNPDLIDELLFLKVLIEGKASLFSYTEGNLIRFFYRSDETDITQLVYKKYKKNNSVATNNYYQQQLSRHVSCDLTDPEKFASLSYSNKSLSKVFINYNTCNNAQFKNYNATAEKKDLFNLTIKPGYSFSTLEITNNNTSNIFDTDFGNSSGFRIGVEAEFVLPYNNNKWSIVIEPTYFSQFQRKETTESNDVSGGILNASLQLKTLEVPIGLRHSFFLNEESKFFMTASYNVNFTYDSFLRFTRNDGSELNFVSIKSRPSLALNIGYEYLNKYGIEFQYQTNRTLFNNNAAWNSDYQPLSLMFRYRVF